jgi:zinc/manganese transport system substrate-binding protein
MRPDHGERRRRGLRRFALVLAAAGIAMSGCSTANTSSTSSTVNGTSQAAGNGAADGCPVTNKIPVVVAENFWGSIATQLGGAHVEVTSIITNPDAEPHDYEASADDARTIATARYVIQNGLGYDPWVSKLADANPNPDRTLLDIGASLGLHEGDNPHRWYFPNDVDKVIDQITSEYQ